ncbi:hypothetical protein [Haladaptatus sp. NG-WS-4]
MSPETERNDDVLDLDFGETEVPFEPKGVLGTDHEGEVLTAFTVAGGGAALVLSSEPSSTTRPTQVHRDELTPTLETGLAYLFRDGVQTVRVRTDPDSVVDSLSALGDGALFRHENVTFTAKRED